MEVEEVTEAQQAKLDKVRNSNLQFLEGINQQNILFHLRSMQRKSMMNCGEDLIVMRKDKKDFKLVKELSN